MKTPTKFGTVSPGPQLRLETPGCGSRGPDRQIAGAVGLVTVTFMTTPSAPWAHSGTRDVDQASLVTDGVDVVRVSLTVPVDPTPGMRSHCEATAGEPSSKTPSNIMMTSVLPNALNTLIPSRPIRSVRV